MQISNCFENIKLKSKLVTNSYIKTLDLEEESLTIVMRNKTTTTWRQAVLPLRISTIVHAMIGWITAHDMRTCQLIFTLSLFYAERQAGKL